MFNKIGLLTAFIGILLMSTTANAILIEDTVYQEEYLKKNGGIKKLVYTHDLTDDGFTPGVDTAISGYLSIDFWDDGDKNKERIKIKIKKVQGKDIIFKATDYIEQLSVQALVKINDFGKLDVKIVALKGDFYVGNSVLSIYTSDVPAPAILSILSIGLFGVGVAGRIRKVWIKWLNLDIYKSRVF